MKIFRSVISLLATILLFAGGQAVAANAAPFGLELGVATIAQVKKEIGAHSSLQAMGTNKYSEGAMLKTDGAGLEIDGLRSALFIFDPSNVLVGVVLTMQKDPKSMLKMLSGKYKVVTNRIDNFMNYGYARMKKDDSFIEIDAKHLSFEMEVRYLTKGLLAKFNQSVAAEEIGKQQRKANAL